jgi:glucose-6-phosphate 1-dehydrogenase
VGDQTLFQRAGRAVQPFHGRWSRNGSPDSYGPGSLGADSADALLARDARAWHLFGAEEKK